MPLKIVREDHSEIIGRGSVLIIVPAVLRQPQDIYAGQIAEEIALLSKAHAIIFKEFKRGDLDGDGESQIALHVESVAEKYLENTPLKFVVEISGKNDPGIEIRIINQGPETEEFARLASERLTANFQLAVSPNHQK